MTPRTYIAALVHAALVAGVPVACRQEATPRRAVGAEASQAVEAPVPAERRAHVEAALHCHALAPGESLAVRLLGTIGPDGSWSLQRVHVAREPGRIVITPQVRHVPGNMVIQMVMPLDHALRLGLEPGTHRIEVRGRDGTLVDSVQVVPAPDRPEPETRVEVTEAPAGTALVTITGKTADGFVERLEMREIDAAGEGDWRAVAGAERRGNALVARLQLPASGRRIEVRSVDGQGVVERTPASATLR